MSVYLWQEGWGGRMHTSNRDGWSILGYGESTRFFKGEAYAQTSTVPVAGPEHFLRPGSPFLICCISGKDGVQIKISLSEKEKVVGGGVSLHTNKAVCNFQRGEMEAKEQEGRNIHRRRTKPGKQHLGNNFKTQTVFRVKSRHEKPFWAR